VPVVFSATADFDGNGNLYTVQGWDDGGTTVLLNNVAVWQGHHIIAGPGFAEPAGSGWKRNGNDQFFGADVDGDHHQELVIWSPSSNWTGVCRWEGPATGLVYVWGTPSPIPGPGYAIPPGSGWNRADRDKFPIWGPFCSDGKDSIIVQNPNDLWLGLLRWDGNGLTYAWGAQSVLSGPGGDYGMDAGDTYESGDWSVFAQPPFLCAIAVAPNRAEQVYLQWQDGLNAFQVVTIVLG
jgi:hypothetical protein